MLEHVLRYAGVFAWNALLGFAVMVIAAWLAYRVARYLHWNRRGTRGPAWLPGVLHVAAWCVIFLTAAATGAQVGVAQALARALQQSATEATLAALIKVGSAIDIKDADQKISLQDAERLAERFAPTLLTQSKTAIDGSAWLGKAGAAWAAIPGAMKTLIKRRLPQAQTSPRELVHMTWRYAAAPIVESGKQQALIFAYGSGFLVLLIIMAIEWLYLAWTRSSMPSAPM